MDFTNNDDIDINNNITTTSSNDVNNKIDSDDEITEESSSNETNLEDQPNASFGKVNMDENETITEENKAQIKKLPYFHRVLSTEDTELIGSITPKLLDSNIVNNNTVQEILPSGTVHASSAWNAAQTWEERNFSKWAEERIPDILVDDFEITTGTGTFQTTLNVNKVDNIKGHASIAHVRGKARYIYEYAVDFAFTVKQYDLTTSSKLTYNGKLAVNDICNDMEYDDINLILTWTKAPPSVVLSKIRSVVLGKDMKKKIKEKMIIFEEEFRNK